MSNASKYNIPNAQKVQIFEQINTYIENNYPTDPEVKAAIADLETLLTQLQTQYPHITTETQPSPSSTQNSPKSNSPKPIS